MAPASKKEPIDPQEAANTAKDLIGGFSGVKTFTAQTGTIYGVIAEAKGLSLAIAPKIAPSSGFVGIYTRIRVQKEESWADLSSGPALFGFPEMGEKSNRHASCEVFVAVALQPTSPYNVGKTIEANNILENLVGTIQKRIEDAGQKLLLSPESLTMYLRNVFETVLPTEEPNTITEFPVCIGEKEIVLQVKALYEKFGQKKKKKPTSENPPGHNGLNPD